MARLAPSMASARRWAHFQGHHRQRATWSDTAAVEIQAGQRDGAIGITRDSSTAAIDLGVGQFPRLGWAFGVTRVEELAGDRSGTGFPRLCCPVQRSVRIIGARHCERRCSAGFCRQSSRYGSAERPGDGETHEDLSSTARISELGVYAVATIR